jgi:hypothetical protein
VWTAGSDVRIALEVEVPEHPHPSSATIPTAMLFNALFFIWPAFDLLSRLAPILTFGL